MRESLHRTGVLFLGLWLTILPLPVAPQVNYGTLVGTVEDQDGGAVAGAIVRVTQLSLSSAQP